MFKHLDTSAIGIYGSQSERIELALTYKFHSMDLNIVDFCNRADVYGVPYARRLIDSAKIKIATFSLPTRWEVEKDMFAKDLTALKIYATAAADLDCARSTAILSPASDALPYHENFELHKSRLSEICEALESVGITLGIGFQGAASLRKNKAFQFIHEMDALGLLVNMVGASNLGVIVDPWNIMASGGSLEIMQTLPVEQIVAVHLADMPEDKPIEDLTEKDRLLPGETGRVDCVGILRTLAERGYQGPVCVASHRSVFKNSRREPVVKAFAASLEKVWTGAGIDGKVNPPSLVEVAGSSDTDAE